MARKKDPPALSDKLPLTTPRAQAKATSTLIMLVATDILLPLLFPPFYCFFLAPFALVPLCICILRRPMNLKHLFFYYLAGIGFFLPNLYWLQPVTSVGWILLSLYLGLYFPLFAFGLHRLTNGLRIPATLAVPLVWTAVEWVRSVFLEGGFPWFMLGNSLAPAPLLIQVADLFGVWGVTFFIAMLNGLVIDVLRLPLKRDGKFNLLIGRLIASATVVTAFVIAYGVYRLQEKTISPGPRVAVIQDNIPQSIKDDPKEADENFRKHIELTQEAAAGGIHGAGLKPDLIAWPETMVPEPVNREMLAFPEKGLSPEGVEWLAKIKSCDAELRKLADDTGSSLLVGSPGLIVSDDFKEQRQNLTLLYDPGTGQANEVYAKVHLVPFGEYIPFRNLPLIGPYMKYVSPYKNHFDYSNEPGKSWTRFVLMVREMHIIAGTQPAATQPERIDTTTHFYLFATPICFEDAMPEPARKMVNPQYSPPGTTGGGGRKTDFLINVSNDGWFFSVELNQRLQASQLRAVENRVPIARAVNTGNSGFVDSCGRVLKLVTDNRGESIHARGTASIVMPLDSRITLFSQIGDLLPMICGIVAVLGAGWTFVRPRRDV